MLTAVLMLCANIHLYKKRKGLRAGLLDSYIEAGCVWTLYLFVVTEALSSGHLMRFRIVFMAWASLDMILAALLLVQCRRYGRINKACFSWSACVKAVRGCKDGIGAACFYRRGRETVKREGKYLYYGITVLIGAAVLWLAYKTTPYNWDSMTYHLPRISYWIQNRSVEHYATNSIRQIASPVLAEFVNLHVCILSRGGDELFNMLQAFSYITCAVLVSRITRKLGGSREFGFMAALIYMTMPIAYAEALTTQVDLFATVWLLFYVYILLDLAGQNENLKFERTAVSRVCVLAACVAWGYLSKPSVCFAMVIFALWLLIRCIIRKDRVWELFRLLLCAIPCVSLPLVPEILRNFKTFQSYANTIAGEKQMVATLQPAYLLVNFLKNFTFNLPTALIKNSERYFVKFAEKAAAVLRVELNAESIAENGMEFRLHTGNTYGHNTAINPIVMWLFLFCAVWTVLEIKKINKGGVKYRGYFLASTISFCFFCVVLRWEIFVTRYMVSYLALLCPMIAVCIQRGTEQDRRRPVRHAITGIVCFLCVMEAVSVTAYHYNAYANRGADSRPWGYFVSRKGEAGYYVEVTNDIKDRGYESIGLYIGSDDYEYPIWKMLGKQRIEHINVQNESGIYRDETFTPDCIIWFGKPPEGEVRINDAVYIVVRDYGENHYLLGTQ